MPPPEVSPEHRHYLQQPPLLLSQDAPFSQAERDFLRTHGRWLEALAQSAISPQTPAQERFVEVAKGKTRPRSDREKLWIRYCKSRLSSAASQASLRTEGIDFVAIDFETANRTPESACALGISRIQAGKIVESKHFFIRPEPLHFEWGNIRVHGIRPKKVKNAPNFSELWHHLQPYLEGQTVVAHNAAFDTGVLRSVLKKYALPLPRMRYACTVQLSRKVLNNLPRHGLDYLAQHYGLSLNHHNAQSDADVCARVLVNLCQKKHAETLDSFFNCCGYKAKIF